MVAQTSGSTPVLVDADQGLLPAAGDRRLAFQLVELTPGLGEQRAHAGLLDSSSASRPGRWSWRLRGRRSRRQAPRTPARTAPVPWPDPSPASRASVCGKVSASSGSSTLRISITTIGMKKVMTDEREQRQDQAVGAQPRQPLGAPQLGPQRHAVGGGDQRIVRERLGHDRASPAVAAIGVEWPRPDRRPQS